jgi:hypothetical protein
VTVPKLVAIILYMGAFALVQVVVLRSYRSGRLGVRPLCVAIGALFATIPFALSWAETDNGTIASLAAVLLSVPMGLAGATGTVLGIRLFGRKY